MHRTTAMWLCTRIVVINDLHHMVALVVIESLRLQVGCGERYCKILFLQKRFSPATSKCFVAHTQRRDPSAVGSIAHDEDTVESDE